MIPGRELDALVAEHVMGYTDDGNLRLWIPHYSLNIEAAWEVVTKMPNREHNAPGRAVDYFTVQRIKGEWRAGYMCFIDWVLDERGDSAPHAICLAALKAVGYKL